MFGFLIYPGVEELDLVGPWEMATMWETYADGPGCVTVSQTGGPTVCAKGLKIAADHSFADCPALDYLLVPGGFAALEEARNPELVDFVAMQARQARHILSVCTGSFILEAAGLLDGRKATTHWKLLPRMREIAGVEAVEERFVRDGNVWTSAGVSAGIDLTLAFIAAVAGEEKASIVQYNAEYYPDGRVYGTAHHAQQGSAYFRGLGRA
ncbi:DJ-1/PfpI family protein [Boseaceae bacterium BT-24-1]|nr:DJ-1/PfpI family protein [Boseaceae bacterium BT-24-1]